MARIDFKGFGADQGAYPGDLVHSWGAMLVEPPNIAELRRRAASQMTTLGQLAPAKSGIPTRVVHYFLVEEIRDNHALQKAGIHTGNDRRRLALIQDGRGSRHLIERKVLRPVVRRPGVLEGRLRITEEQVSNHRIFYTHLEREELRNQRLSHAQEYIRYGETTDFPAKKGSRRRGGVPSERPNVRTRRVWFHLPQIEEGPGRVCWIKGRGNAHYAPVLDKGVLVPDNFQISAPPEDLDQPEVFGAVANLTFTHLMTEIVGRRSGGAGVLHTYIRELNKLPLIDPRLLTPTQVDDLLEAFEPLKKRRTLPIGEELNQADRQTFDVLAMRYLFGTEDAPEAVVAVTRAIRQLAAEREQRSSSGKEQVKRAAKRSVFNAVDYAARALKDTREAPDPAANLSLESTLETTVVEVPEHTQQGELTAGNSLFDLTTVSVGDETTVEAPTPPHAQLVTELLRRRADMTGPLILPVGEKEAAELADTARAEWNTWSLEIHKQVTDMLPGRPKANQRREVLREVEKMQGIWPGSLAP